MRKILYIWCILYLADQIVTSSLKKRSDVKEVNQSKDIWIDGTNKEACQKVKKMEVV